MCRSVRTIASIRAVTEASRHTSIRRENGGFSRWSCPRIGQGPASGVDTDHARRTSQAKGGSHRMEVIKDLIAKNAARDHVLDDVGDE